MISRSQVVPTNFGIQILYHFEPGVCRLSDDPNRYFLKAVKPNLIKCKRGIRIRFTEFKPIFFGIRKDELHRKNAEYKSLGFQRKIEAMTLNEANLKRAFDRADILVNTTSVGMTPDVDRTPVPGNLLGSRLVVSDIVYNPLETRLLREAKAAGARTIDGLDMLVWQGALAFEKWTAQKAPFEIMKQAAIKALQDEK